MMIQSKSSIVSMTRRDTCFDSIKYVLMFLVVLGHTLGPIDNKGTNLNCFLWINSFHMPAFVLISGYFYKDSSAAKFRKGIAELICILLIFSILYSGGGWLQFPRITIEKVIYSVSHIYAPQRALWYILSLCIWRVMLRYCPKTIRENWIISILLSLVASLFVGLIPYDVGAAAQRTFTLFPYFLFGYYVNRKGLWAQIRRINHWKCAIWLLICYFLIENIPNFPFVVDIVGNPYNLTAYSITTSAIFRFLSYFWMFPMAICVLNLIPDFNFFSNKGKDTLFYLVFHPFGIMILGILIRKIGLSTSLPMMIIYTTLNMCFMYWLNKIPILNYMTKPLYFIKVK